MKITNVEVIELEMPFDRGVSKSGEVGFLNWGKLDFCLIKVETDAGIIGWGDAFAFQCRRAVAEAVKHMVAPRVIGRDPRDIARISHDLQQALHIFGRYGITMFAISGIDIALWDIAGKAAGMPLYRLLGASGDTKVPAYASLFRYEDPELVADRVNHATSLGYGLAKLHEIAVPEVRAAREAGGDALKIMVDTNCPWTPEKAREMTLAFSEYDIHWIEEPINPPEDFRALAKLREDTGVAVAAGENACTAFEFRNMLEAGAVDYAQPSVTKVGGITEFRKVAALCESFGVQIMPHSPYFGPGFLATLHLAQALPNPGLIERIFIKPEADFYAGGIYDPVDGVFGAPSGPGLGIEPDPDVIKTYRVG
ncbi:MAG: mandelate racemase/muconate lactonizing enzyme family protein [Proteobacteria bacterium]|nr:mandelate racemase/muconate lactonizing enzyme family protein [Pseudomonadota bacterium]MDA1311017.1 mandelate racemase/muconate lactonizing enzyme family protein [Pseudomonadota bacterium]